MELLCRSSWRDPILGQLLKIACWNRKQRMIQDWLETDPMLTCTLKTKKSRVSSLRASDMQSPKGAPTLATPAYNSVPRSSGTLLKPPRTTVLSANSTKAVTPYLIPSKTLSTKEQMKMMISVRTSQSKSGWRRPPPRKCSLSPYLLRTMNQLSISRR